MKTIYEIEREIIVLKRKVELIDQWISVSKYSPKLLTKMFEKTLEKSNYLTSINILQGELLILNKQKIENSNPTFTYKASVLFFIEYGALNDHFSHIKSKNITTIEDLINTRVNLYQYIDSIDKKILFLVDKNKSQNVEESVIQEVKSLDGSLHENLLIHCVGNEQKFVSVFNKGESKLLKLVILNAKGVPYYTYKELEVPEFSSVEDKYDWMLARIGLSNIILKSEYLNSYIFAVKNHFFLLTKQISHWFQQQEAKLKLKEEYYLNKQITISNLAEQMTVEKQGWQNKLKVVEADVLQSVLYFKNSVTAIQISKNGDIQAIGRKAGFYPYKMKYWNRHKNNLPKYIASLCNVQGCVPCEEREFKDMQKVPYVHQQRDYEEFHIHQVILNWEDVHFFDNHVQINFGNKHYLLPDFRSRSYFNHLKNYLPSFNKNKMIVEHHLVNDTITILINSGLDEVFDRLEIEHELTNEDIKNSTYFVATFLNGWSNNQVLRAFKPHNKTLYLRHLCEVYSANHRIVPMKETRLNDSTQITVVEDAFLFPVSGRKWLYILWESVQERRATHVFRCQPHHYAIAVQRVFDYVASPDVTNKRDRLRQGDVGYFNSETIQYCGSLNHDDLDSWIHRLNLTCY